MKKRIFMALLFMLCACMLVCAFTACGKNDDKDSDQGGEAHTHTYADAWLKDAGYHWHACTVEGCNQVADKAAHVWDNDADTTCNICGYERAAHTHQASTEWSKDGTNHWHLCSVNGCNEQLDKAAHTYDNDADTTCNVCGYERPAHTHQASTEWLSDETNHWHLCTVDGCGEKLDTAAHIYDQEVVAEGYLASEASYTEAAKYFKSCVCGKKGTETFANGDALEAKENQVLLADGITLGKTYDGEAYTLSGDKFTANGDGAMTFEYKGAGEAEWSSAAPVNAGSYEVRVSVAATAEWKAAQATFDFTIAKKQLTISGTTVADKEYDGTVAATVTAGTLAGLIGSDEVSVGVTATGTFASKDVAYEFHVDPQDVTISYALTGTLANNYIAPVGETLRATINPKTLSNVNLTKDYDGSSEFRSKLTTEKGIVDGENIEIYVQASSKNVGVYKDSDGTICDCIFYDSGEETSNYAWGNSCTATITAKQLTVTGTTVADKSYDGTTTANVTVGTLDGVVNGETVTVSASGVFASAAAGNDITVTVTYLISGADSGNYLAPVTDTTLTADILDYARFSIASKYNVAGKGTVVTGTVVSGIIYVNDTLTLCGANGTVSVKVTAIQVDSSTDITSVTPETEGTVGLLLEGVSESDIQVGDWLITSTLDVQKAKLVTVSIYFKTQEEGGRHTPVYVDYKPSFLFNNNKSNTATLISFSGNENADMIMPSETVTATFLLTDADYILVGDKFALADSTIEVATGTILSIDGIEVIMTYDEDAGYYTTGDVDFSKTIYANVDLGDADWKIIMDTGIATYKVYDSAGSEITVVDGEFTLGVADTVTIVFTPVDGGGVDACAIQQQV